MTIERARAQGWRFAIIVVGLAALSGCSAKAWYEGLRLGAANDCRRQPPGETDGCLARVTPLSYEEYERKRTAPP